MNFLKPNFWNKNKISIISIFLFPISILIQILFSLKKILKKKYTCSIPIICVGNIYLGGTGKTPLCIEMFLILSELNMNPAFIRKKYDSFKDEAMLQKKAGAYFENKKRVTAIRNAIKTGTNVAILDDGFQDFSINKDVSIVCFSEKQWIGNGLTIPSGPLRESMSALNRANYVVINGNQNIKIENQILKNNKNIKIFYTSYVPINIEDFKNKKIIAFAGIGNPNNFFDLLKENNLNILEQIHFSDHHHYSEFELNDLIKKSEKNNAILLTTEKDYMRISEEHKEKIKYLKIKSEIQNRDKFIEEIKKYI
jgi:tetraacyldisaccharide 4'-kinase